jgi:hypothetical protein
MHADGKTSGTSPALAPMERIRLFCSVNRRLRGLRGQVVERPTKERPTETLGKLSREAQIVLAAAVLYLISSFFDWQQVSFGPITAGISEWHRVGVIAGLFVIAVLAWEAVRIFIGDIEVGPLTAGFISVALAFGLLLVTVITFLTHNEARHWPSWIGLILSLVSQSSRPTARETKACRCRT